MAAIVSGIITIQVDAFDNEKVEKVDPLLMEQTLNRIIHLHMNLRGIQL